MQTELWGAMPSRTKTMSLGDRIALARASELARAGLPKRAIHVLRENGTLLEYSPEACDLVARIGFYWGDYDTAHSFWQRADWLAAGAEPYHSTLASFRAYVKWRQRRRRRRECIRLRLRRKARRLQGKAGGVARALILFLKRLLCWRRKSESLPPLDLPPPAPTSELAPPAATDLEQAVDETERAEAATMAPTMAADAIPPPPASDMEAGATKPPAAEQAPPDVSTAPAAGEDGGGSAAGGDKRG